MCFKAVSLLHSPQANLAVFVPRGNAVIFGVTGDARKRVPASLLVVFFEGKPFNSPHRNSQNVLLDILVASEEMRVCEHHLVL